ncbi:MAG: ATP-binding protein [Crocinitomicaceae bacterium]
MSIKIKYLLAGILFGLIFPIVSILVDCCIFHDNDFSFDQVGIYLDNNPIHYIVASAPFFLGIAAYMIGYYVEKQYDLVQKLRAKNDILNDANESLDSFNYHVSHDLKTVLSNTESLTLMLQKYVEKDNKKKVEAILERLLSTARNGRETIKSFLEFGKATSIVYKDNAEVLLLEQEISQIAETHFMDNKLQISIDNSGFTELKIDKKAVESIFMNLFTNSIKYNDNPKAITHITLAIEGDYKKITYTDNGIGIDVEANKDKLFKPFEKIQSHTDAEGTGVGLYLIKKITSAYNGKIKIESVINEGTSFIFYFPKEM